MRTLYLVSHTHWDREWYQPFQIFRLKLVHLVDTLLDILDSQPDFLFFMLDGQTIILDDYLQVRLENRERLRRYIQEGRVQAGPWFVSPDEFLISPEAIIRNLFQGKRSLREFSAEGLPTMPIGYLPDQFGHIGQMPQILRGFHIQSAILWRGLADEPCELWWKAPDGSRVLLLYLRDSYSNAATLQPDKLEEFTHQILQIRDSLARKTATSHILLMNGTDHQEPDPRLPAALRYTAGKLKGEQIAHATLLHYIKAVQREIQEKDLKIPTVQGELRSSKRSPMLVGVLSTRMWIKQRNEHSQMLMEKWVEPFCTWADQVGRMLSHTPEGAEGTNDRLAGGTNNSLKETAPLIRHAWRMLMENHPHDSICGCSIDQVCEEMRPRFDQVDQIAGQLVEQSLEALSARVNTNSSPTDARAALIIFNSLQDLRTDTVTVEMEIPPGVDAFELTDNEGEVIPHTVVKIERDDITTLKLNRFQLQAMMGLIRTGKNGHLAITGVGFRREGTTMIIDVVMQPRDKPDAKALQEALDQLKRCLSDWTITAYQARVRSPARATIQFIAKDVNGCGYRTLWIRPAHTQALPPMQTDPIIENEIFRVTCSPSDGTFIVFDKRSNQLYTGLNRFQDGGDAGDEYNYSPPKKDATFTSSQAVIHTIKAEHTLSSQSITLGMTLEIPAKMLTDHKRRSSDTVPLEITTRAVLYPGVPRLDIHTEVENRGDDHRLTVHFPAPFSTDTLDCDGHFEVVKRSIRPPRFDRRWIEQPRPEVPVRAFASLSNDKLGLMIACRGLPEIAALPTSDKKTELSLTLLRCVGWLSRDDLTTREGPASPIEPTPGAQMHGKWFSDYSIIPLTGDWFFAYPQAYAFTTPLRAVNSKLHEGIIPDAMSFVDVSPSSFVLSAIKTADDGSGVVIRGYNIEDRPITVHLLPWQTPQQVFRVSLDEIEQEPLQLEPDGSIQLDVNSRSIVTILFK